MLLIRQECSSVDSFQEFEIPSKTGGKAHRVLIHPHRLEACMCDCDGFRFRGSCSHVNEAAYLRCDWIEGDQPTQTIDQQLERICPRCGQKTTMVVVSDE